MDLAMLGLMRGPEILQASMHTLCKHTAKKNHEKIFNFFWSNYFRMIYHILTENGGHLGFGWVRGVLES